MSNPLETVLGHYRYTPLDKLATCTLAAQPGSQRFYLKERLSTEIQGAHQYSIMQHEDYLLAQQQRQASTLQTHLLVVDQQRSVLALLDATHAHYLAYSPYGHRVTENGLLSLLGFNGERPDPVTGHYHLGNGYRQFNPVLMRFNSPDSWSPFGQGGLNAYGYCAADPINQVDPTGHMFKHPFNPFRKTSKPSTPPVSKMTLNDLDEDSLIRIVKKLPSSDVNNLRLVSKDIKSKVDRASNHNFKVYLNKQSPHIFYEDRPATQLDKVIEVGLGKIPGVSSSEAGKIISVKKAQEFYDTHTASSGSYQPTSLITDKAMFFTRRSENRNHAPQMDLPKTAKNVREN